MNLFISLFVLSSRLVLTLLVELKRLLPVVYALRQPDRFLVPTIHLSNSSSRSPSVYSRVDPRGQPRRGGAVPCMVALDVSRSTSARRRPQVNCAFSK